MKKRNRVRRRRSFWGVFLNLKKSRLSLRQKHLHSTSIFCPLRHYFFSLCQDDNCYLRKIFFPLRRNFTLYVNVFPLYVESYIVFYVKYFCPLLQIFCALREQFCPLCQNDYCSLRRIMLPSTSTLLPLRKIFLPLRRIVNYSLRQTFLFSTTNFTPLRYFFCPLCKIKIVIYVEYYYPLRQIQTLYVKNIALYVELKYRST